MEILSYKNVTYGKDRVRRNYSRVQTNVELPNLIEIQTKSYDDFIKKDLKKLFASVSPIKGQDKIELYFGDYEFGEPEHSIEEAKRNNVNYSWPLKVDVLLKNNETGEIKQDKIFMGDYPKMTPWGTFVINGAERIIVTQIIRSAGVFYSNEVDKKSGKTFYSCQVIPTQGVWLEYELGNKDIWYAKFDRQKKIPLTTFLRAIGLNRNKDTKELFGDSSFLRKTFEKDDSFGTDDALEKLYDRVRPGEKSSPEGARIYLAGRLFNHRQYDLASVGRYKFNKKLDIFGRLDFIASHLEGATFKEDIYASDSVDPDTGEIIENNTLLVAGGSPVNKENVDILRNNREALRKTFTYDQMLEGNSVILDRVCVVLNDSQEVKIIGNDQREDVLRITLSDILASISYYMNLHFGIGICDDIDHLSNRRLRPIGEQLQIVFNSGLGKLEKTIRDRITTAPDPKALVPQSLINVRMLTGPIREFFSSNQLSQFMDQINPLSELTHKRRISALGTGGLTRDRAGFEVRDVHVSHYGKICPIETPEGQNIGLINSIATYARANEYGFIETPYLIVEQKDGHAIVRTDLDPVYLTADKEELHYIAQANVTLNNYDDVLEIADEQIMARYMGETVLCEKEKISLMDVSPKQIVAVSTACIPFLEHDDANRALMGTNMQRQAIPLLRPEAPIVATGIEAKAAKDSGVAVVCENDGEVVYSDALKIIVKEDNGFSRLYKLTKFCRSNQSTCVNQQPIVSRGERVKAGDVLADGASMDRGEMALGRNVVIAFMTWNGYNYEDAVIMNERLVQDDVYTSIHIESYEVEVRDTKLGKEEITCELDNAKKETLANLDERGIVRIGAEVKENDVLVGKVTPKGQTEPTPEERLSNALFADNAKDVKNTSFCVPHGGGGIVHRIDYFSRANGDELGPGVNEKVRIFIVQKRKISEGDKMSGRHGNKGVISRILPQEDMPYMEDGTPVDIMLNPQGIPSRLNIGQVLEVHLGMAAKKLGIHVATPVFDGVTSEDLEEIMKEAGMAPDGKCTLIDGRTGKPFDNRINVGVMYMIKLAHMVDDKLHARSDGPYTMVTQQPMGGKAQNGGQRFGEMEVWALEAYGAAYTLREMLTIKSDDIVGRAKVSTAIVQGTPIPTPGIPEAFRVLIKELQGLGLSVKLIDSETKENVANKSLVDEISQAMSNRM